MTGHNGLCQYTPRARPGGPVATPLPLLRMSQPALTRRRILDHFN